MYVRLKGERLDGWLGSSLTCVLQLWGGCVELWLKAVLCCVVLTHMQVAQGSKHARRQDPCSSCHVTSGSCNRSTAAADTAAAVRHNPRPEQPHTRSAAAAGTAADTAAGTAADTAADTAAVTAAVAGPCSASGRSSCSGSACCCRAHGGYLARPTPQRIHQHC
jgi:hypothetical protein